MPIEKLGRMRVFEGPSRFRVTSEWYQSQQKVWRYCSGKSYSWLHNVFHQATGRTKRVLGKVSGGDHGIVSMRMKLGRRCMKQPLSESGKHLPESSMGTLIV